MVDERNAILRAIAVVGNAVALFVLIIALLNARAIFQRNARPTEVVGKPPGSAKSQTPSRLLLILLDGLRYDIAEDPETMPHLQELARRGSRGEAWVEALIPSTIAGLRAEVEGIVAPPGGFVFDFASAAAPKGGFLQVNREQGGRSFVAAPWLWRDLYSRWIDEAEYADEMHGEDQRLLEAGLQAAADRCWQVVVVHLSRPDVAAHLAGGASPRYRAAAAWCDAAVGQLVQAAGAETTVVVTSDHGTTDRGGHAGPEPSVHRIPVVAAGPSAPKLPEKMRQVEIAAVLESVVAGTPLPHTAHLEAVSGSESTSSLPLPERFRVPWIWAAPLALLAALAASRLVAGAPLDSGPPRRRKTRLPFAVLWHTLGAQSRRWARRAWPASLAQDQRRTAHRLHAGFWAVLAVSFLSPVLAAWLGALWLLFLERRSQGMGGLRLRTSCLLGVLSGIGRIAAALKPESLAAQEGLPSPAMYLWQAAGALALGLAGAGIALSLMRRSPRWGSVLFPALGALVALLGERAFTLPGETVSLSTLDVRAAWAVADTWAGLPGTVLVGALQPYAPLLCLLLGSAVPLAALCPRLLPSLAAGAGGFLLGEALSAGMTFALHYGTGSPEKAALALALLARIIGAVGLCFPLLALLSWGVMRMREHSRPGSTS